MLLGELADTIANLITFAFIGAMIWLLARPLSRADACATARQREEGVDEDQP